MTRRGAPRGRMGSLTPLAFGSDASRRSVLDRAHRGDIIGGLGRLSVSDTSVHRSRRRRLAAFLAIMGPGVVVMVAGNDAGSLATVAQAGEDYGLRLVWLIAVLAGALFVIQEMAARLGAVTGAGLTRLIKERFGPRWSAFAFVDLVVLGVLTVITEFIGVELGLGYFGINRYIAIPAGVALLLAFTATGSFRRWERGMYALIGISLAAVPLAVIAAGQRSGRAVFSSHLGQTGTGMLFAVGVVGATVAPWQVFFQQSSVVDKRITARWLAYERADTAMGTALYLVGGLAVLLACAVAFHASPLAGRFVDAGQVARGLRSQIGSWAGGLYAIVLIDGSLLGAGAVGLASSYAVGDVFGTRHSLHRRWGRARAFYFTYALTVVAAAAVAVTLHGSLGTITLAVQALSGALFPSVAVFLLMLANDRALLGPHVNSKRLNAMCVALVAGLVLLGCVLDVNIAFPRLSAALLAVIVGGAAGLAIGGWFAFGRPRHPRPMKDLGELGAGRDWTMPPIETLAPPVMSRGRALGLIALRGYLVVTVVFVIVRLTELL